MNIAIIEDEYLMADDLEEKILNYDSSIQIVAKLTTVQEAINYFKNKPLPHLFFSDIQLPDGLSFDIFRAIKSDVPVIFCTAYHKYALNAFQANGIDYILKPFNTVSINNTLIQLDSGISYALTFSGKRFRVDFSMDAIEKVLGAQFFRANRQFLVNSKSIDHVSKYFARKLLLKLNFTFTQQIIVSKANASVFLDWLEKSRNNYKNCDFI